MASSAIEILSRLPVKSLMQFKCVSVSFYNLISNDPLFRKKHLHHQSNFKKVILVPHYFQSFGENGVLPYPIVSISSELGDVSMCMIELKLPICGKVRFHSTCDGLFCMSMSGGGDVVIWNPTTRRIKTFQSCRLRLPNLPNPRWIGYSLAHDPRCDIYKLLGLTRYRRNTYKLFHWI
ncbi:hypothetical protein CASFOL_003551 [Castilleja foliolosa]|uniref:F-box domain-containing protein n=1 Tax=Castilleja foliolosa TaxID=1961234 RepID=A0ABD3EHU1_9LAMI